MAYDAYEAGMTASPIWSGTLGPPVFHHYIWGFIGCAVAYMLLSKDDFIDGYQKLAMKLRKTVYEVKMTDCPECSKKCEYNQEECSNCGFPLFLIGWIIEERRNKLS